MFGFYIVGCLDYHNSCKVTEIPFKTFIKPCKLDVWAQKKRTSIKTCPLIGVGVDGFEPPTLCL